MGFRQVYVRYGTLVQCLLLVTLLWSLGFDVLVTKNSIGESALMGMNASRVIVTEPRIVHGGYSLQSLTCQVQRESSPSFPLEWIAVQSFDRPVRCVTSVADLLNQKLFRKNAMAILLFGVLAIIFNFVFLLSVGFQTDHLRRRVWWFPYLLSRLCLAGLFLSISFAMLSSYDHPSPWVVGLYFASIVFAFMFLSLETFMFKASSLVTSSRLPLL